MSVAEDLRKQKEDLRGKIAQTEQLIGSGLSWKDAQFYLEKYKEQIRVIDNELARAQLGEDAVTELKVKKARLDEKMQSLEQMKKEGTISDKVYKDKKKDIDKEIKQTERDIVDMM